MCRSDWTIRSLILLGLQRTNVLPKTIRRSVVCFKYPTAQERVFVVLKLTMNEVSLTYDIVPPSITYYDRQCDRRERIHLAGRAARYLSR